MNQSLPALNKPKDEEKKISLKQKRNQFISEMMPVIESLPKFRDLNNYSLEA
jgi:hypothetical protein